MPVVEAIPAVELDFVPNTALERGSMVQVSLNGGAKTLPVYGVIRWIGMPPGGEKEVFVGIESEDNIPPKHAFTGKCKGHQLFTCTPGHGLLVRDDQCSVDQRFTEQDIGADGVGGADGHELNGDALASGSDDIVDVPKRMFGNKDCPIITGRFAPISK